ncbi:MAG: NAD(P)/FAD-dependent oxidoreductase [Spirochaetes bacterium]|nr:NAD(P)/FAD-dependent oxidoreductase [Spirochaetota bacterium]
MLKVNLFKQKFFAVLMLLVFISSCSLGSRPDHEAQYDAVIVGAGMSGLSAATHLASKGLKVLVLEQHDRVGGCTTSFKRGEFTIDAALHAMAGGGPGRRDAGLYALHKLCGVDKHVKLYELPHLYRSVFPGIDITLPANWEGFKNALKERWPDESEGIEKFHRICRDFSSQMMSLKNIFRYSPARAFLTKLTVPFTKRTFFKWQSRTLQELLDECFESSEIKAVVSQLWVYYGGPAPEQTAVLMLAATEVFLSDGAWHVTGTSQALANAYAKRIRELGGEVRTDTLVTKIVVEEGMARAVETAKGETFTASYVVSNTDPYQLVYKLVGEEKFPSGYVKSLEDKKPANSLFGVYMGLNIDLKKRGYDDTEIFYNTSMDTRETYENMMKGDFSNGVVVVSIYSNYGDPIYAPMGKSYVTVITYSDISMWPDYSDEYYDMKDKKVDELITLAAKVIPELADPRYVELKEGFTPRTIRNYTMNKDGVVYGFYASPDQMDKVPNHTPVDNLFIASNWSQGWHGVSAGQINGWRAARLILDREGIE